MDITKTTLSRPILVLSLIITLLAAVAAGTGLFWQGGDHFNFTTLRGESVSMQGGGLYALDSVAGASQEIGQDIVTLLIGIPLLIASTIWGARGSLRGKVLRTGTLGYFLYTYTAMSMLTAYNEFFLLYVALMSLSLFAFVMSIMEIDISTLPAHFSESFPRPLIAGFVFFVGGMLALLWLRLIVPPLLAGTTPAGLESYTTLVIQAMDLGFIMPAALLAGVLLLKRAAFGYLLSSVVLVKGFTMGSALLAMTAAQLFAGVPIDVMVALVFAVIAVVDMVLTVVMMRSIKDVPSVDATQSVPGQYTPQQLSVPGPVS